MNDTAIAALPKNYRLVYDVVHESGRGNHLNANQVFTRATALRPGIGFSTVYRALSRLRDLGLIAEIVLPGSDSATYEPVGEDHAHFHCRTCGRIEDVEFSVPKPTLGKISAKTGFQITSGVVTFEGICERCRTNTSANA